MQQTSASNRSLSSASRRGRHRVQARIWPQESTVHARESTICRRNFTEIVIGLLFHQALSGKRLLRQ